MLRPNLLFRTALLRSALGLALSVALTAALTVGANAQVLPAPLLSGIAFSHAHKRVAPPRRDPAAPTILSGRSVILSPRPGGLGANSGGTAPWISAGPSSVQNAYGTVGGNLNAVSGRVAAIAADPNNKSTFYVAAAGGGVWKTTNGGTTYTATTDFLGDTAMGSVAVAPSNSSVVYAGTGEPNNSGDSKYGIGLLKSTNGGASWSVIPGPSNAFVRRAISKIAISPTSPSTVYLTVADFAVNGLAGSTGVWKTTDGGTNWTNTTAVAGLDSFQPYSDLVMNPSQSNTLYAAIGNYGGSSANGVYKTTNGGTNWTKLAGFPTSSVGRIALALAASAPATLYASVSSSANYGLLGFYKTTDSGTTWTQMTAAPNYLGGQGWYDNAIAVSPTNPNQVFAGGQVNYGGTYGTFYALAGTQDGGATFQDYSIGVGTFGPHTDLHALTFTADGSALLDGNDGGVWRLENPSAAGSVSVTQWTNLNTNLNTIQFTGIALHPTDASTAYGGSQDNGTEKYTGSAAWTQVRGGDGGFTRVDQSNPNTVYHEYYGISLERSDDGGATWNGATNGINPNDPQPADGSDPAAFYVPFKLDPANQSRVIYATDHVYESTDKGDNFTAIGIPGTNGYNPAGSIISTIGVVGSTIYAAAGSSLFATYDDGANWTNVSISGFGGHCSDIFVSPFNAQDVYVARSNFGGGKVYHSTDGGTTWSSITGNLPDTPVNAILSDATLGKLYAGGDDGVYVSSDGGTSWARLDPGSTFPNVQVVDLALSPGANLLAAGTHGRGLFEMVRDNTVSAPYKLTAVASYSKIVLKWQARATYGETYNVYRGTTPGGESSTPLATGITAKTYTDTTPVNGTTYYYKVKMVLGGPISGPSNEASATGTNGPPTLYVPTTAYPTIQSALDAASDGVIVQVADGTYTGPGNVDLDFEGKAVTVQSQHGAASTIIDCGGTSGTPHRAFLFHSGETASSVVSGFTIKNANGPDEGAVNITGGSGATLQNCVFSGNVSSGSGAGLYNDGTAIVKNCTFSGNTASGGYQSGAGIYSNGTLSVLNSAFTGNHSDNYGAGIDVNSGTATVTNCTFSGNTASDATAIINFSTLTLVNCTATGNSGGYRALYSAGTATLTNDILFGDGTSIEVDAGAATATFCDIQGGYSGTGNINADPLFNSPPADLHLKSGSPCIGAGTHSGAPATDKDGTTRANPPSIGAYEGAGAVSAPVLSSLSPASATAGGPAFTLTVNGVNFIPGSIVKWNGASQSTTFVSSTKLTATISASLIASAGTASVTVTTPHVGTSAALTFTINPPTGGAPTIASLTPSSATAGGPSFTLTVNGTNFASNSIVKWNGASQTTTFVSSTKLTATIPASLITTAGTATVTVTTPHVGTSAGATFTVNAATGGVPVLTSISPTSRTAGSGQFTLTANGTNFASNSIIKWNGASQTTTFVSSTKLTATIPASLIAASGTATITVTTPHVGTSGSKTLTINP